MYVLRGAVHFEMTDSERTPFSVEFAKIGSKARSTAEKVKTHRPIKLTWSALMPVLVKFHIKESPTRKPVSPSSAQFP